MGCFLNSKSIDTGGRRGWEGGFAFWSQSWGVGGGGLMAGSARQGARGGGGEAGQVGGTRSRAALGGMGCRLEGGEAAKGRSI